MQDKNFLKNVYISSLIVFTLGLTFAYFLGGVDSLLGFGGGFLAIFLPIPSFHLVVNLIFSKKKGKKRIIYAILIILLQFSIILTIFYLILGKKIVINLYSVFAGGTIIVVILFFSLILNNLLIKKGPVNNGN